jgi:hypothetical protein
MMLKILTVHNQQESTVEEKNLSTLFNSIGVDKILSSTIGLFNFHSSNGQMASSDCCYCDRACLPATQSSNGCCDVGGPLLLVI